MHDGRGQFLLPRQAGIGARGLATRLGAFAGGFVLSLPAAPASALDLSVAETPLRVASQAVAHPALLAVSLLAGVAVLAGLRRRMTAGRPRNAAPPKGAEAVLRRPTPRIGPRPEAALNPSAGETIADVLAVTPELARPSRPIVSGRSLTHLRDEMAEEIPLAPPAPHRHRHPR